MKLMGDSRLMTKSAAKGDFTIGPVRAADYRYWREILGTSRLEFGAIMLSGTGFVLRCGGEYAGLMYHGMMWDSVPMLNMAFVNGRFRKRGAWRFMMEYWETVMSRRGYNVVMVCVPSDMPYQNFYRELGYSDCGSITLRKNGEYQPADLFLSKYI